MIEGLSKRAVLRAGYGAVIAVLVLSAIEAYRIQVSISAQHQEIYRRYLAHDAVISTLRRNLWLAGNYVRDLFINSTPQQAAEFHSQIAGLKQEDEQALRDLARLTKGTDIVPKLRKSLGEFWAVIDPLPGSMLGASDAVRFEFLQHEVMPRRGELYNALSELMSVERQRLQENQKEFGDTRRLAARRLLGMLGLSLLLAFLVARLSLRHAESLERQTERNYAEVERARGELQQLSARLLEIEEEGKRQLSRELHDEIGQTLALLQIEISHAQALSPADADAARRHLLRARELAERTVQTIRNISLLLRPALLDDLGLVPALQFQLEEFLRRSGIQCEFEEDGVDDHLPDTVKTCVYRVVQEALHNCEKHSRATRVRVAVRQRDDCVAAEVEDNGTGFALNQQGMPVKSSGLGLLGMRERVALARGSLVVNSAPGRGTRIEVRIPLSPSPAPGPKTPAEVHA